MVYKIPRVELFVCIIKIPSRRGRTRTKNLQTMQWCELDVKLLFLGPLQIHFVSRPLGVYNSFLVLTPFFVLVWYRRQEDNDVTLMKLSSWICLICPRFIKLHPNIAVTVTTPSTKFLSLHYYDPNSSKQMALEFIQNSSGILLLSASLTKWLKSKKTRKHYL